jgi:hypothetical protein
LSFAREKAREKLYEFIVHKIGLDVKFTYDDLPPIRELSEEFYKEYSRQYEAVASGIVMLSSVNEMALGELLQELMKPPLRLPTEPRVEVVEYKTFVMTVPPPIPKKRSMKELVQALVEAKTEEERWSAVQTLTVNDCQRRIPHDEEGLQMLKQALGNQDSEICRAAAYVSRFWPDERAFKPLLRCLGIYGDTWKVQHAASALDAIEEKMGKFSVVTELYAQALLDEDPAIRRAASERFKTHPIIHIEWLDREGRPLSGRYAGRLARVAVEKNTKTSTLLENQLGGLHLPRKIGEGKEIGYALQTDDGKYLDSSETLEKNLQEQRIDSLILRLKIARTWAELK